MLSENTLERTWLMEQYLAGNLTDDQHQLVELRRTTDSDFDRQVLAHWLVQETMEQERNTLVFEQAMAELGTELAQQKRRYTTVKQPRFLWNVLLPGLMAASVAIVVWLSWPPPAQFGNITITSADGMGFGDLSLVVARYAHEPGLLGRLRTDVRYRWPNDTLFLYGRAWQQTTPDSLKLERIDERGHYQLHLGQRTYDLLQGQTELTKPPVK